MFHLIWNNYTAELAKQVYVFWNFDELDQAFSILGWKKGRWIRSGPIKAITSENLNKLTLNFSLIPWWSGWSLAEQALGIMARQLSFWNNDKDYTNLQHISHWSWNKSLAFCHSFLK